MQSYDFFFFFFFLSLYSQTNFIGERVLWTDETKLQLFGHNSRNHVWRKDGDAFKPKNTVPKVKFGGGSIMVWGCFFCKSYWQHISNKWYCRMNTATYQNLIISVENLELSPTK